MGVEEFMQFAKEEVSNTNDFGWDQACKVINEAKKKYDAYFHGKVKA